MDNTLNQNNAARGVAIGCCSPGNMTTMPKPGAWATAFACKWDAWQRLVEIKQGTTQISLNDYDAFHRRTRKTTPAETRDYYFDRQWRSIEERVSGAVKSQYTWSPFDRWTLIRRKRSVTGTLDESLFCLKDHLDPAAVVNSSGAVQERFGYDAFGPVRFLDASFAPRSSSTVDWNLLFHAEFRDPESGLYNYGYRFYHPSLGRWISRDPIGEEGGLNLYGFNYNNPPNRGDVFGSDSFDHGNQPPLFSPPSNGRGTPWRGPDGRFIKNSGIAPPPVSGTPTPSRLNTPSTDPASPATNSADAAAGAAGMLSGILENYLNSLIFSKGLSDCDKQAKAAGHKRDGCGCCLIETELITNPGELELVATGADTGQFLIFGSYIRPCRGMSIRDAVESLGDRIRESPRNADRTNQFRIRWDKLTY